MKREPAICQEAHARDGLHFLQLALESFKKSENKQTAARVRAAISSAKGAVRICGYRKHREPHNTRSTHA